MNDNTHTHTALLLSSSTFLLLNQLKGMTLCVSTIDTHMRQFDSPLVWVCGWISTVSALCSTNWIFRRDLVLMLCPGGLFHSANRPVQFSVSRTAEVAVHRWHSPWRGSDPSADLCELTTLCLQHHGRPENEPQFYVCTWYTAAVNVC